jgi:predicted PurR-regulated permease PerM
MLTSKKQASIERWFFILVAAIVLFLFWKLISPFALVLVTAGIVGVALSPIHEKLTGWIKHKKIAAVISVFGVFVVIMVPLFFILLMIVNQAAELIGTLGESGWFSTLDLQEHPLFLMMPEYAQAQLLTLDIQALGIGAAEWAVENVGGLFASTTKLILNMFLFFAALYFLLVDRERLYQEALVLSPFNDKLDAKIIHRIISTIRSVVFGILIMAVIQGFLAGIGMTIFGVPGAVVWGAFTIIAAMVPFVGTSLILIPAILFLFITGNVTGGIGLLVWGIVIVSTVDNILAPFVIKESTHMNMFLVLLSVIGGINAFGFIGFIVGPTILAAFLVVLELYKSGVLKGKKRLKVK